MITIKGETTIELIFLFVLYIDYFILVFYSHYSTQIIDIYLIHLKLENWSKFLLE